MTKKRDSGFTLVELLMVVAIIGILAMIAIINYRNGLEKARQKRTMTDIRSIATSWEARAADMRGYNAAGWTAPSETLTVAEISGLLAPTYTKSIVKTDGWGRPLEFLVDEPIGGNTASTYAIRSMGSDAAFQGTDYTPGTTNKFDCDIVYSNGTFIQYPE
jgi:prepilin-type N-terminal cleavage/methylation domain-containing protein